MDRMGVGYFRGGRLFAIRRGPQLQRLWAQQLRIISSRVDPLQNSVLNCLDGGVGVPDMALQPMIGADLFQKAVEERDRLGEEKMDAEEKRVAGAAESAKALLLEKSAPVNESAPKSEKIGEIAANNLGKNASRLFPQTGFHAFAPGEEENLAFHKNPLRVVLDRRGRLQKLDTLTDGEQPWLVLTENPDFTSITNGEILNLNKLEGYSKLWDAHRLLDETKWRAVQKQRGPSPPRKKQKIMNSWENSGLGGTSAKDYDAPTADATTTSMSSWGGSGDWGATSSSTWGDGYWSGKKWNYYDEDESSVYESGQSSLMSSPEKEREKPKLTLDAQGRWVEPPEDCGKKLQNTEPLVSAEYEEGLLCSSRTCKESAASANAPSPANLGAPTTSHKDGVVPASTLAPPKCPYDAYKRQDNDGVWWKQTWRYCPRENRPAESSTSDPQKPSKLWDYVWEECGPDDPGPDYLEYLSPDRGGYEEGEMQEEGELYPPSGVTPAYLKSML